MRLRVAGALAFVVVTLLTAGCGSSTSLGDAVQPRDGRAGLQVTGRLGGAQLGLSEGSPQLVVGDCDPRNGGDRDVCAVASDIHGTQFVLAFENPDVLEAGASLAVADPGCVGLVCDGIDDVAVIDVQTGTGRRVRATGGRLDVTRVEPFSRYVGTAQLQLPNGELSVVFDLVPRAD